MSVIDKSVLDSKDSRDKISVLFKGDSIVFDDDVNLSTNELKKITITVTNIEDGWGIVKSYPTFNQKSYKVPLYICSVEGLSDDNELLIYTFKCIRFGVEYRIDKNIGPRIVGLKDKQSYTLKWVKRSDNQKDVWQVKNNWLIHEGVKFPQTQAAGALGCIEIVGSNEWTRFNKCILELTNSSSELEVSKNRLAIIEFEEVNALPPLIEK